MKKQTIFSLFLGLDFLELVHIDKYKTSENKSKLKL